MASFKVPDRSVPVRWRGALDGLLPDDHLARFVWDVLCGLDFSDLEGQYPSVLGGPGRSPYHPRLLAALWIYGMSQGLETAAGIAEACRLREDFQWLAGGLRPVDQTLLNFLTRAQDKLSSLWAQVLRAMQEVGLVDLSLVAEDGTKLRANASPRSFRTLGKIEATIGDLQGRLDARLQQLVEGATEASGRKATAEIAALRARLTRARRAGTELKARVARKGARGNDIGDERAEPTPRRFAKAEFRHDAERDVLSCPAGEDLRFIGEYPTNNGRGSYRLFGRRDCSGCPLKAQCTAGRGRRVKMLVEPATEGETAVLLPVADVNDKPNSNGRGGNTGEKSEPTASLTEPEAVWMLATSRKRWEPCFNADIAVTPAGIIVSQFLTNDCTDFHHFAPALAFVTATLGKPEHWVGDGHYGTEANLVLADREGVELYAPRSGVPREAVRPAPEAPQREVPQTPKRDDARFGRGDFRPHPERDALLCPADEELRYIGEYPTENRRGTYRLYGRRDCSGCSLKERCTRVSGRRVKVTGVVRLPAPEAGGGLQTAQPCEVRADDVARILDAHRERMENDGADLITLRGHACESANAHLKQHGLARFHVHGLARCGAVLTLACIGHNLMKWAARAAVQRMTLAA